MPQIKCPGDAGGPKRPRPHPASLPGFSGLLFLLVDLEERGGEWQSWVEFRSCLDR